MTPVKRRCALRIREFLAQDILTRPASPPNLRRMTEVLVAAPDRCPTTRGAGVRSTVDEHNTDRHQGLDD